MSDEERVDGLRTLAQLERRRWQLWLVAGIVLLATSLSVITLVLGGPEQLGLPPVTIVIAILGVTLAFLLYAADRERIFRRVTRTVFEQVEREQELVTRVQDLKTLVRTSRSLNTTLSPEQLYDAVLSGAMRITDAERGALFLRHGDALTVAVSRGPGAPPPGKTLRVGEGDIGRIAVEGDIALTGDGPIGVCAPIVIRGVRVGVLAVERGQGAEGVTDREVTLVRLLAEQAATAVANATSYERERVRVETLIDAADQRSDFVARMVHDLRAPLSAVSGYGQLIRDRGDRLSPDQRTQAVDGMLEQTARLNRMVDEILSAASVEAGAEVTREPVDLAELLDEVARTGRAAAESSGSSREIDVRGSAAAGVVHADPEALRHVFSNLVDNALKYSPDGTPVTIGIEDLGDEVVVHVVDRGQGIAEADQTDLFERFRQADGTRRGVGLGLYIVRTLVQAHGGRVAVRSREGQGSAFTVTLPRKPDTP